MTKRKNSEVLDTVFHFSKSAAKISRMNHRGSWSEFPSDGVSEHALALMNTKVYSVSSAENHEKEGLLLSSSESVTRFQSLT